MRYGISAILFGIGCISTVSCAFGGTSGAVNIRYVDSHDGSSDEFHIDHEGVEAFDWAHYLSPATRKREGLWEDFVSSDLNNCSDDIYQCLIGDYTVFAVPRAGLTPQSAYSVRGVVFRVEECLREQDNRCERALVSADCHWMNSPGLCSEMQSESTRLARGPVMYFVFDGQQGVLSYGSMNEPAKGVKAQLEIARQCRLKSPKGLCAPDIALPASKQ